MLILALDTATLGFGVALANEEGVLAVVQGERVRSHARYLMGAVDDLFKEAGCTLQDVQGIAVTEGPGSFTGLRIGVATAKGLASAWNLPTVGISTLHALAMSVGEQDVAIQPAVDAKKGQVYTARYRFTPDGLVQETEEMAMYPRDWVESIQEPTLFVGDGALVYQEALMDSLGDSARFVPEDQNRVSIQTVAEIALQTFERGNAGQAHDLKASYIRKADAKKPKVPFKV